jgi:DNA-binding response OmpR family regulator
MAEKHVLVAQLSSDERAHLVQAFEDEDFDVETCDDGEVLLEALTAMKHDAFIVASDLKTLSGQDAIVSQQKRIVKHRKSAAVFLVQDIDDALVRDEYQRYGVAEILSPATTTDALVRQVTNLLFKQRRAAVRHDVDMPAVLRSEATAATESTEATEASELACKICEISETGVGLIVSGKVPLLHGAEVKIEFLLLDTDFSSQAIVRRITQQRRFVRVKTRIGLQLVHATEDARRQFARMLTQHLELERELATMVLSSMADDPDRSF